LIDWQNHQWDTNRIRALFHPYDADVILQVPLSRRAVQDVLAWSSTKNGRYNVKSEYHVAKQLRLVKNNCVKASVQTSRLGFIYEDIWCLIAGFRSFLVNCVRHSANGVAHALARFC